jgi:hypothetical protein
MSRTRKLYQRLDGLESELREAVLEELRRFAEGRLPGDEFHASYLFRRPFPEAKYQIKGGNSEWMLGVEREIRALRQKLGEEIPGPAIGLVDQFESLLREDLDRTNHEHGNSWTATARAVLAKMET